MSNSVNIGIDLGTTNTLVCMELKGKPKCLKFKSCASTLLPSVLYYNNGKVEIGRVAIENGILNPKNMIRSSKTFMGENKVWTIDGRIFSPTDVATEILKEVKNTVLINIKRLGLDANTTIDTIITVPAYFSANQIEETKKAGLKAGLNVKRIITEPMAAAVAYISDIGSEDSAEKLFVMDLGGGTFDLSLLQYNPITQEYETLCVDGDRNLGGDDFDNLLIKELQKYIFDEIGLDLTDLEKSKLSYTEYQKIQAKLKKASENAKIELSNSEQVTISIPNLCTYRNKDYDFDIELTRDEFNDICTPLFNKIFNRVNFFIKNNNININEIWRVALVGGSCNIPYIRDKADKIFPNKVFSDLDLSTLVVTGAYIVSTSMNGVGVKTQYSDILSHSLGIEVVGEEFKPLLNRYQKYPCSFTSTFTTVKDYQTCVDIRVFETKDIGNEDKTLIKNCNFYGSFVLDNIEKAKQGIPQIDVTFEFDDSRILTVTAVDKKTHAKKSVILKSKNPVEVGAKRSPMDIFLLIDASGSMYGRKMTQTKKASYKLINDMIDLSTHRLGIVSFGSNVNIECGLSQNKSSLNLAIDRISSNGTTNLSKAILKVTDSLLASKSNAEKYMIILTDGHSDNDIESRAQATMSLKKGIKIITIGVGLDNRAKELLFDISSNKKNGSKFTYNIENIDGLTEIFKEIVGELASI